MPVAADALKAGLGVNGTAQHVGFECDCNVSLVTGCLQPDVTFIFQSRPNRNSALEYAVTPDDSVAGIYSQRVFDRAGRIDLLVNNAGIVSRARLAEFPDEDWRRVVDVDLTGVYLVLKHFARLAPREDAIPRAIVNVASMSYRGMTQQIAYVSAKGGVVSLTRGAALELAADGIRVNCVAPGMVETDMAAFAGDALRERMRSSIPLRRYGTPAEVAATIAFLLSDDAAYITGETLHVAGGARL